MGTAATVRMGRTVCPSRLGRWPISLAAAVGGSLVIIGSLLPWLTLLAGLRSYAGTAGTNGQVLLVGGTLAVASGLGYLVAGGRALRWGVGLLGFALLAGAAWLTLQLLATYRELAADPFAVAALGPGLFVALGGAGLVFATLFLPGDDSDEASGSAGSDRHGLGHHGPNAG